MYAENERYDGPAAGLADLDGAPHYFTRVYGVDHPDVSMDEYFVWPVDETRWLWNVSSGGSSPRSTRWGRSVRR